MSTSLPSREGIICEFPSTQHSHLHRKIFKKPSIKENEDYPPNFPTVIHGFPWVIIMNKILRTSQNILIEGKTKIRLLKGKASVFQGKIRKGEEITIPTGRILPIRNENGKLRIKFKGKKEYQLISGDLFPSDWYMALEEVKKKIKRKPKILIMGGMNTGKSSLTLFLSNWLLEHGKKQVGIIDSDIGQSKVGFPGIIGAAKISSPLTTLYEAEIARSYFVGDKSPTGHLLQMVTGVKTLSEYLDCQKRVSAIIVDTTGMIFGGIARALKRHKIEMVSPDLVFTLEQHREMEHIIREHPDEHFYRLSVPKRIKALSRPVRIELRNEQMKKMSTFPLAKISINLQDAHIQQSILRNGAKIPKEIGYIPKEVTWIELSAEGMLIIPQEEVTRHRKKEIIGQIKRLIKTLKGIKSMEETDLLNVGVETKDLLEIVKGVNLEDLRISILPHTFYNGLLIGLKRGGKLYALGRIQKIDFKEKVIHIEAHLLPNQGTKGAIPLPISLILGFLRFDQEWNETGKRRVGQG